VERVTRTLGPLPKQGLHARPAARLVETAKKFRANVTLTHGGTQASAKDLMDLLYLAAPGGTFLELTAEGDDASAAADAVAALLASLGDDS
jgi:phosphotransferase system HPr (HPr) family protein